MVGLGYILPRQTVNIYKGDQASNVLDRGLKANGYSYGYTGSLDRGFYLASIRKPGIGAAASVPETLQVYLEDTGAQSSRYLPADSVRRSVGPRLESAASAGRRLPPLRLIYSLFIGYIHPAEFQIRI